MERGRGEGGREGKRAGREGRRNVTVTYSVSKFV